VSDVSILCRPNRLLVWHLSLIALILGAHGAILTVEQIVGRDLWIADWRSLIDPDQEGNLTAWLASMGWFLMAGAMFLASRMGEGRARAGWTILALIAGLCGLDEAVRLHERFAFLAEAGLMAMKSMDPAAGFAADRLAALQGMLWVFVYPIVFGLLMLAFARPVLAAILSMATPWRLMLLSGGALFVAGAVGMEIVSALGILENIPAGEEAAFRAEGLKHDVLPHYRFLALGEETLEFVGVAVAWNAVMRHLAASGRPLGLTLRFGGDPGALGLPA
jgi:hypothetical protein